MKCKKCGRELPLNHFYNNNWMSSGKNPYCKECLGQVNTSIFSIEMREDLKTYFDENWHKRVYFKPRDIVMEWVKLKNLIAPSKDIRKLNVVLRHPIMKLRDEGKIEKFNTQTWKVL